MGDTETTQIRLILDSAIAAQQPFFTELLTRLSAIESREIKRDEALDDMKMTMRVIADRDYQRQIDELERDIHARIERAEKATERVIEENHEELCRRIEKLEAEVESLRNTRTEWQGVVKASNWVPRLIGYLAIIVSLLVAFTLAKRPA